MKHVDFKHPQYEEFSSKWERVRDALDSDRVRSAGTKYLPQLSGMESKDYQAYKQRSFYYGATRRTRDGISGLVFRKDATVTLPNNPTAVELLADVTLGGLPHDRFAQARFNEELMTGFGGIYVTLPRTSSPSARGYMVMYSAEQIINWRQEFIEDKFILTRVVLEEQAPERERNNPYSVKFVPQFRDLWLDEQGLLVVDVYQKNANRTSYTGDAGDGFTRVSQILPVVRGQRIDFIPFAFDPHLDDPPLLPLADANLDHWRLMADYRHGLHWTGLPTPYVIGGPDDETLAIGPNAVWQLDEGGSAGMLEFTGQGLGAVEKAVAGVRGDMASLGARLIDTDKAAAETSETHRLRQGREQATTATITQKVEAQLSQAETWMLNFSGIPGEVDHQLNKDLADERLTPEELTAFTSSLQAGAISYATFYELLQKGELARKGVSAEEEALLIEAGKEEQI